MNDKCFVDTNILIYAQDAALGTKQQVARDRVHRLWMEKRGFLRALVLQEFCVRILPHGHRYGRVRVVNSFMP